MALAETAELAIRINLEGNAAAGIGRLNKQLGGLTRNVGRAGKGVGQIGSGLARAGLFVGGAAIAGITAAAKAAIDFEDAFAGVRKTVNEADLTAAGLTFEGLAKDFREMATEMPLAATEFARLGEIAGALGVDAEHIVKFTEVTAKLGVTTNLTADEAADSFGRIGTILSLTGKGYEELADSVVALGNAGASTESEIVEITKRFAATAKQAGLTKEQMVGLASATASLGFEPERGGSALARVFANMATNISTANSKGKALGKGLGKSVKELQRDIDRGKGLNLFLDVLKEVKGLSPTAAARFLKDIGVTNVSDRTIFLAMSQQLPFVNEQLEIARKAQGALLAEAEKKFATTASKIAIFKNNLIESGIAMGEQFLPAVGRALDKLITAFKDPGTKGEIAQLGKDIGAAIDGIDWNDVIRNAKAFVGVLKGALSFTLMILDAVNKLPTELKAAGAGFLALNKLSGGLVGAGVGNVVGGLAGALTQGLASRAPGVGRLFAQPVFVTNWPVGGLGGGVPGGAKGGGGMGAAAKVAAGGIIIGGVALSLESINSMAQANAAAADRGLNAAERAAQHYYGASLADQSTIAKRLGYVPTKADFQSGNAKLKGAVDNSTAKVEGMRALLGVKIDATKASTIEAGVKAKNASMQTKEQVASSAMINQALLLADMATTRVTASSTQGTIRGVAPPIVGAIRANRPVVTTIVNVTATHVTKSTTVQNRYGPGGGSGSQNARPGDSGV